MTTDVIRNFKTSVKVKVKVWVKPINFLGLILLQYLYSHYYSVVYHYIYTWYYTSEIDNTSKNNINGRGQRCYSMDKIGFSCLVSSSHFQFAIEMVLVTAEYR
jgi:hypothetical protein